METHRSIPVSLSALLLSLDELLRDIETAEPIRGLEAIRTRIESMKMGIREMIEAYGFDQPERSHTDNGPSNRE